MNEYRLGGEQAIGAPSENCLAMSLILILCHMSGLLSLFFDIIKMLGPFKLETDALKLWKISSINLLVIFFFAKIIFF